MFEKGHVILELTSVSERGFLALFITFPTFRTFPANMTDAA
jgi:hypothetical protein